MNVSYKKIVNLRHNKIGKISIMIVKVKILYILSDKKINLISQQKTEKHLVERELFQSLS